MTPIRKPAWMIPLLLASVCFASAALADPQASEGAKPARAAAPSATTADGRFSKPFQRALESGQAERASAMLLPAVQKIRIGQRAPSSPAPSAGTQVAAPGSGPLDYTCNSGNCACAGASDCITMISADNKCVEGTVGCNDYGCTCKEN